MIEHVTRNVTPSCAHKIYWLVRDEHIDRAKFIADKLENVFIVPVKNTTQGAACTVLLASEFIDNSDVLVIANSDQLIDTPIDEFISYVKHYDGGILTFESSDPKWSYARVENDLVCEVAEKKPISSQATVGVYFFKHGHDFVTAAKKMILKDIRVYGEFYVAPIYNEMILDGKKIAIYGIDSDKMHGLGTPIDFEAYVNRYRPS
jgi:dTDP-glucose pyrophosphorylase